MARGCCRHPLLVLLPLLLVLAMVPESAQLQSSRTRSLPKIQQLLNYPRVLRTWGNSGDYKTASTFVERYGDNVTQLHIMGPGSAPLPKTFSVDAFFTTLTRLPDLRVLTLTGLGLWGPLPGKVSRLVQGPAAAQLRGEAAREAANAESSGGAREAASAGSGGGLVRLRGKGAGRGERRG